MNINGQIAELGIFGPDDSGGGGGGGGIPVETKADTFTAFSRDPPGFAFLSEPNCGLAYNLDSDVVMQTSTSTTGRVVFSGSATTFNTPLGIEGTCATSLINNSGTVTLADVDTINSTVTGTTTATSLYFNAPANTTDIVNDGQVTTTVDFLQVLGDTTSDVKTDVFQMAGGGLTVYEANTTQVVPSGATANVHFQANTYSSDKGPSYDDSTQTFSPVWSGAFAVSLSICCQMAGAIGAGENVLISLLAGSDLIGCRMNLINPYPSTAVITSTFTDTVIPTSDFTVLISNQSGADITLSPVLLGGAPCRISFAYLSDPAP